MPEEIKISELPVVGKLTTSAMFPESQTENGELQTFKATAADIAAAMLDDFEYPENLETDSKKIIGAINESARKVNALQSIVDGIKVEFQKNHEEGDFTFKSGVIGSVLQGLQGKSEKTKNLLKPTLGTGTQNGVTCTKNVDGTYTLNGTCVNGATIFILDQSLEKGTYKIFGCPNGGIWGGTTNTYRMRIGNLDTGDTFLDADYGDGRTITLTTRTTIRLQLNIAVGYTCNNLVFKPMITTDLSATYADYVPYFDGLRNSAVTKFTVNSKNLAYVNEISAMNNVYFECENMAKNIQHTVSFVGRSSFNFNVQLRNRSGAIISTLAQGKSITNGVKYELTFTPTEDDLRIFLNNYNGAINLDSFQIERGSVATSFTPYFEPKDYPITFNGKSAGSVRDEVDLVRKKYIRRVGSVDLGSLNWRLYDADKKTFETTVNGIIKTRYAEMLSSIYTNATTKTVGSFENMDMRSSGNSETVYFRNTAYSSADAFKSAMSGVIINYELAEPVIEDIETSEVMAVVNAGDRVTFDGEVPVGSDWNDLVFLKGV